MKVLVYEMLNLILYSGSIENSDMKQFVNRCNQTKIKKEAKIMIINEIVDSLISEMIIIENYESCKLMVDFKEKCNDLIGKKTNR